MPTAKNITKDNILHTLKEVVDPEININIVDLGLVRDIEVNGKNIKIRMTLTTIGCPIYDVFVMDIESTLKRRFGEDIEVNVEFVFDEPWSPEMMSDEARRRLEL